MKILLDCRFQKGAGPNVTSRYLVRKLLEIDHENEYLVLQHQRQGMTDRTDVRVLTTPARNKLFEFAYTQTVLPRLLARERVDLYHSLKHLGPLLTKTPKVLPIRAISQFLPGMQKLSVPDRIYWKHFGKMAWRRATHIFAVSGVCRDYLVEHLGVDSNRVEVLHHGVHERFHPRPVSETKELRKRFGVEDPFLLAVGNLYAHKNYETAIRAFHSYRSTGGEASRTRLLIVGDRSYAEPELERLVRELGLGDAIGFTGFVPHEELAYLYSAAELLLFCSIYEAFPNPIVEAMASGLPVIAADRGAAAELSAGAAELIADPYDHAAFAEAIGTITGDASRRAEMSEAGQRRARDFSWDATARRVLAAYRRVAGR